MKRFIIMKQLDLLFLLAKFARFLIKGKRLHSFFYRRMAYHINGFVIDKKNKFSLCEDVEYVTKGIDISMYVMNTEWGITEYLLRNPRRGL